MKQLHRPPTSAPSSTANHLGGERETMDRKSFRDLRVWQEGLKLALSVYSVTRSFPQSEVFGLASQMQRAAVSIPANIAEGRARKGEPEFVQFLHQAAGSLAELETYLELVRALGYCSSAQVGAVEKQAEEVGKMLYALIAKVKTSRLGAEGAGGGARRRGGGGVEPQP